MTTLLIIAGVLLLVRLGLFGALLTVALRAESRQRRLLVEQAQADARIQLRTQAALNDLYDSARQAANDSHPSS